MTKTDQILEHIIGIEGHLGKIDGHLRELNGKTDRNIKDIEVQEKQNDERDEKINKIDKKVAYYAGGIGVAIIVATILVQWMFKYVL